MKYQKIVTNKIKCKHCGDVIESVSVHDFKTCSCGSVSVDGGKDYLKRSFKNSPDDFEDLSECMVIELSTCPVCGSEVLFATDGHGNRCIKCNCCDLTFRGCEGLGN